MGEMRSAYRSLVGKPDGNMPRGKYRRGWQDNIKMDLKHSVYEVVELNSYNSGYGPVEIFCEHGNELSSSIKDGECLD
jgi:hypothetical protein